MIAVLWNKKVLKMPHLGLKKALKSTSFRGLRPLDPTPVSARSLRSLVTQSPNLQVGTSTSIHFCFGASNQLVEKAWPRYYGPVVQDLGHAFQSL